MGKQKEDQDLFLKVFTCVGLDVLRHGILILLLGCKNNIDCTFLSYKGVIEQMLLQGCCDLAVQECTC